MSKCYNPGCQCNLADYETRSGTVNITTSPQFITFQLFGEDNGLRTTDYALTFGNNTTLGIVTVAKHGEGFEVTSTSTGQLDYIARTNKPF